MASIQSLANKRHYEMMAGVFARGPAAPETLLELSETEWGALTGEPRDVDYVEVDAGGTPGLWTIPKDRAKDRAILYAHGGGFVGGSIYTHRKLVGHLAKAAKCHALLFHYPYAHEHKHPKQLDVTVAAYSWLLGQNFKPQHVALGGDSCGAILSIGLLERARDVSLPLPAAVLLISGWFDLTVSAQSFETNRDKDALFQKFSVDMLAANFLGDAGDRRDPYASPLHADLAGFPPMYLQAGADEALVDESRLFADKAKAAGVEVRLDVFPEMLHSFQMMAGRAPEADDAVARLADWVRPKLGLPSGRKAALRPGMESLAP
jgi:monoterpene epsilon-lactone hydrolase